MLFAAALVLAHYFGASSNARVTHLDIEPQIPFPGSPGKLLLACKPTLEM